MGPDAPERIPPPTLQSSPGAPNACAAESTTSVGAGEGLMRAGAGNRAGPWKGMLFVGEEESQSGA